MTNSSPRPLSEYQRAGIAAYTEQQLRYYSDQAFSPTVRKACAAELLRRTGEHRHQLDSAGYCRSCGMLVVEVA